jgi:hypothetical protein
MFNFDSAKRARGAAPRAGQSDALIGLDTPVQFDPGLVPRLLAEHAELDARFTAIIGHLDTDPSADRRVRACSAKLHDLRRTEALWLYPLIARGIARDPVARRQFLQLRLLMLGLARRVLRSFDELSQAVRRGTNTKPAASEVTRAMAEYRQRNETEIYPLYELMGTTNATAAVRAAVAS